MRRIRTRRSISGICVSRKIRESFIEYYYKEKTKDNEILVKKDNGLLISMVQYNPYAVKLRGRLWKLDYLVGVATEESRRREGHFPDVFVKMLHDEGGSRKADHVSGFRSTRLCMRQWDLPSSEMWHPMS